MKTPKKPDANWLDQVPDLMKTDEERAAEKEQREAEEAKRAADTFALAKRTMMDTLEHACKQVAEKSKGLVKCEGDARSQVSLVYDDVRRIDFIPAERVIEVHVNGKRPARLDQRKHFGFYAFRNTFIGWEGGTATRNKREDVQAFIGSIIVPWLEEVRIVRGTRQA